MVTKYGVISRPHDTKLTYMTMGIVNDTHGFHNLESDYAYSPLDAWVSATFGVSTVLLRCVFDTMVQFMNPM